VAAATASVFMPNETRKAALWKKKKKKSLQKKVSQLTFLLPVWSAVSPSFPTNAYACCHFA
jgi:hypothetical protein